MRQERQAKERLAREKDVLIAEKFNLEQQLAVSLVKTFSFAVFIERNDYNFDFFVIIFRTLDLSLK